LGKYTAKDLIRHFLEFRTWVFGSSEHCNICRFLLLETWLLAILSAIHFNNTNANICKESWQEDTEFTLLYIV